MSGLAPWAFREPRSASPASVIRQLALRLLALAILAGLGFSLAGRLGRLAWWLDLWSHFPMQLALGLALLTILAGLLRARRLAALAAAGLALNLALLMPLYLPPAEGEAREAATARSTTSSASERPLRILSFNVLTRNPAKAAVIAEVQARQPDILALIETDTRWLEAVRTGLPGYRIVEAAPRPDNFGMLLAVRKARDDLGVLSSRSFDDLAPVPRPVPAIEAALSLAGRPFSLLILHTMPPKGGAASAMRDQQLAGAVDWAGQQRDPALLLGDFNTTPFSPRFTRLIRSQGLRDSSLGRGYQATWSFAPSPLMEIPIDHAVHGGGLTILDRQVGPHLGSDHRLLELLIALP